MEAFDRYLNFLQLLRQLSQVREIFDGSIHISIEHGETFGDTQTTFFPVFRKLSWTESKYRMANGEIIELTDRLLSWRRSSLGLLRWW